MCIWFTLVVLYLSLCAFSICRILSTLFEMVFSTAKSACRKVTFPYKSAYRCAKIQNYQYKRRSIAMECGLFGSKCTYVVVEYDVFAVHWVSRYMSQRVFSFISTIFTIVARFETVLTLTRIVQMFRLSTYANDEPI